MLPRGIENNGSFNYRFNSEAFRVNVFDVVRNTSNQKTKEHLSIKQ